MKEMDTFVVSAEYKEQAGNPYLEALPEPLSREEFNERIQSELPCSYNLRRL